MITAKEAKQLYDESGFEVEQFLKVDVEEKVTDAAKQGKRTVTIHLGCLMTYQFLENEVDPLHKAVVEKLKELGYTAQIERYGESYVPRGLGDDLGHGPLHTNFGIRIGW